TFLKERCQEAGSQATTYNVYNGFDQNDFPLEPLGCKSANCFQLIYMGTLWNLTSAAPIIEAVRILSRDYPLLAARLELIFVGRRIGHQNDLVESLRSLPCQLSVHDYLDHDTALKMLRGADASCLLLADLPGAERVVPAKLFEYMAARRPILG